MQFVCVLDMFQVLESVEVEAFLQYFQLSWEACKKWQIINYKSLLEYVLSPVLFGMITRCINQSVDSKDKVGSYPYASAAAFREFKGALHYHRIAKPGLGDMIHLAN